MYYFKVVPYSFRGRFKISSNELILQPYNKHRRSKYVHTLNFNFPSSNAALGASFEVARSASRGECFWKTMQREASQSTSKLAPNAVFELGKVQFEVFTYSERRGLLSGFKICSFGAIAESWGRNHGFHCEKAQVGAIIAKLWQ